MSGNRGINTKLFSMFLVVLLIATMLPINAFAVENNSNTVGIFENETIIESGECGNDVYWALNSDGVLTIYGNGAMTDYSWTNFVPNTPWYKHRSAINKIIVNNGVTSIGSSAFYKLSNVTNVELTDTVLAFKSYAFASCYGIKSIELPSNIQYIANYCFENCTGLTSVTIPESVTKFGDCVFTGCNSLNDVQLPSNMETLPRGFFSNCKSLEKIKLPNSITEFSSYCFRDCISLKEFTFPTELRTIGYRSFAGCTSLENIEIPETITSIESEAFYNCSGLIAIEFPKTIKKIPNGLCYGCTKLEKIEIPETVATIDENAFYNCISLKELFLNEGLKTVGEYAFYKCNSLKNIFIPRTVSSLGAYSFGFYKDIYDEITVLPDVKFYCYAENLGVTYADNNGIPYSIIDINIPTDQCAYTGVEITPVVEISIDGQILVQGKDFSVEYENNINIGTAIAKIFFINDYADIGKIQKYFRIGSLLSECDIILDKEKYQYHMSTPKVTVKAGDYSLVYGTDYEVYYTLAGETWKKSNASTSKYLWDLGECVVRVVGLNNYIGEYETVVNVGKFDLSNAKLMTEWIYQNGGMQSSSFDLKNFEYDGKEKKQFGYRVCDDNDTISTDFYDVSYRNNVSVGTATMIITGKGDYYTGSLEKHFEIYPKPIKNVKISKKPTKLVYNNKDKNISVSGGQLTVYYQNGDQETVNMTASMLKGNYNLSVVGTQRIWLSYKDYSLYYEISVIRDLDAPKSVTASLYGYDDVKVSWSKVANANAYNVYYKKSSSKSYTYIGRTTNNYLKKDNFADGVKYEFKVVPCTKVNGKYYSDSSYKTTTIYTLKKVTGVKVVKDGTKVKVCWSNISGESGYQISRSTKKDATNIAATFNTTSGKSKTISATKGKIYYYKVRAFKVVNGKKIYAPWSATVKYVRK